jgi:outer membrane usher protein
MSVGLVHHLDGLTTAATVDYGGRLGRFGLGLSAQLPLGDLAASRAAASIGTELGGFSTSMSVGYDPRQLGWYGGAQVTGALSRAVRLSAAGRVGTQSSTFSVTLGYEPDDRWRAAVNTVATRNGPAVRASATYQPTPDQAWSLAYGAGTGYAEYRRRGAAELVVGVGTGGEVSATVRGTLAYAAGRVYASAAQQGNVSVLLETGVPGLAIYAGGLFQGRTDAAGTLVFSVASTDTADVQVDVDSLPLEVNLKEASLPLAGLTARAVKVDWRENFGRSRIVDFQGPDGQDAAYGTAVLGGERYELDAFGTALLPVAVTELVGELQLADGTTCAVRVAQDAQIARCTR